MKSPTKQAVYTLVKLTCLLWVYQAGAGDLQWKPNTTGDWFAAENWKGGVVPSAGDHVVLTNAGGQILLSQATPKLASVTIGQTLVFTNWNSVLCAESVTVCSNGVLGLARAFVNGGVSNNISIACNRLVIESGGRIDADAGGYAGGVGHAANEDPTSAGHGPGAGGYPMIWGASAGGSYGGRGGTTNARPEYGQAETPDQPGSGGGAGMGAGGAGGGAIRIAANEVCIDGLVTACGENGIGKYGGGGSGGGIWIECKRLRGSGEIQANGGDGLYYAGGGGGGRIAIHHKSSSSAVQVWALGGANGLGGYWGSENPSHFGEAGTLWFTDGKAPCRVHPLAGHLAFSGKESQPKRRMTVAYHLPWRVNEPIVTVRKEKYRTQPRTNAAPMASRWYTGPKGEMSEFQGTEARDDVPSESVLRFSSDHGRTWSAWTPMQPTTNLFKGVEVLQYENWADLYDKQAGVLVGLWLRQIHQGGIWNCFTYTRLSKDYGRTWSEPRQLRYEPGVDFDPANPLKPEFLVPNQAYWGNNIIRHSNGSLITCATSANDPADPANGSRPWKMAALCFIGQWDKNQGDYVWTPGRRVSVPPSMSSRGLMEAEVAELRDKRVLVVWRGSDTPATPGRKWHSVSSDGGRTLSAVRPWTYDDDTLFYSPSSYHRMIRHSVTGKLYWIGNITHLPPSGNMPRFPLVIAEVDESIPALKRNTVTLIDTQQSGQGPELQLSNFSLIENRETHALELFLTTYGQQAGQENWMNADSIHYILSVR